MSVTELGSHEREFERTPPHDVAAEQSVIGGMLISPNAIAEVVELLRASDFYRPAHQILYDTILDLYGRGEPADAVTVVAELTKRGDITRVGGAPYLHTLMATVPTAANAAYYAKIVRERAMLRKLVEVGTRIVQLGYSSDGADADDVLDRAQAEVFAIADKRTGEDYVPLSEIMPGALDEIEAIGSRGGQMVGVPTGFSDLDALTNGLHPGQMVIVAARPAIGKALAIDTPLPVVDGWKSMGDIQIGDQVIGADGRPTRVVAVTGEMTGRPCYEVEFSDGEVIVADAEHQWLTGTRASRRQAAESLHGSRARRSFATPHRAAAVAAGERPFPATVALLDSGRTAVSPRSRTAHGRSPEARAFHRPIKTTAEIARTLLHDGEPNHAVPLAAPFDLPAADLPVDPYLLGVWLTAATGGDAGGRAGEGDVAIECFDDELLEAIAACGQPIGRRDVSGRCALPGLGGGLRALGVLDDRRIPRSYLRGSERQRRALLAGLLDAGGLVSANGRVRCVVGDRRLAEGVHELALSLGHRASLRAGQGEAGASYTVELVPTERVFRLSSKAARQRQGVPPEARVRYIVDVRPIPSVPVRCIQVDNADHLYLAGRACIPTHNSTLALDFARAASIRHGLTSAFFSLEMGRNEITMRLLSAEARVALHAMRSGTMQDEDWTRLARRMSEVAEAPLFIDDSPNMSMMEIRAKCRRLKQQHDLRLVIIDYLQLMTSGKRVESRQVEVSEFSRSLKLLAKELGVPVIALSQLNRGPEQRTDKKPMVSDLRESGSIEQDADVVILLHREDAYEKESPRAGEADLIVAKHRNGPTATVTVAFQGHYSRFVDMAQ
ncbi:replicative DNA helicase [Thermomonospora umbrina]|uniref:Replicative DNA helicase n=1 Tax=Thermomonospora umbrina TaxID=111806 RepID=A0A3D9SMZ2_9ACTN|nr:replicative DNA helicase [Thermomonospora umbrina]REE97228.1 replicative DNA helicase [Thermomonospora umbrina]